MIQITKISALKMNKKKYKQENENNLQTPNKPCPTNQNNHESFPLLKIIYMYSIWRYVHYVLYVISIPDRVTWLLATSILSAELLNVHLNSTSAGFASTMHLI